MGMHIAVGPHDGRKARRKRCNACARRKIKCDGGTPCEYCSRTKQACTKPSLPSNSALVFVGESANTRAKRRKVKCLAEGRNAFSLLRDPDQTASDRDIPYFFTSFLAINGLLSSRLPAIQDLLGMIKDAPALRAAVHAVASHHRLQHDPSAVSRKGALDSLESYGQAVRYIQNLIASNTFFEDPSALWTTFFLGVFELMRDSTGTLWLSHFLHGTCTILRLQDPLILTHPGPKNAQRRLFFLHSRIFEITRSLIYSSPTFLWEPAWTNAIEKLWDGDENIAHWHPKEALFDMLPAFSELSIRAAQFAMNMDDYEAEKQFVLATSLADEGFVLRENLDKWRENMGVLENMQYGQVHVQAASFTSSTSIPKREDNADTDLLIAYIYYHSTSIYLSGTYDYHVPWTSSPNAPPAPILSPSQITTHLNSILSLSYTLLRHGVSGIFLFFPLRVAGARARSKELRTEILELFAEVKRRGFGVAEALRGDLVEAWESRR